MIDNLDPADIEDLELESIHGVFILGVFADSPAEGAGITAFDIIISVDGETMRNKSDLTSFLAENYSPGDTVSLAILREGEMIEITVELASRPE